jgi:hypothetical protein
VAVVGAEQQVIRVDARENGLGLVGGFDPCPRVGMEAWPDAFGDHRRRGEPDVLGDAGDPGVVRIDAFAGARLADVVELVREEELGQPELGLFGRRAARAVHRRLQLLAVRERR